MNALQSARIDHIQINVIDLTAAKQFYDGVLGLVELPRPESFDFGSIALGLTRVVRERERQRAIASIALFHRHRIGSHGRDAIRALPSSKPHPGWLANPKHPF